MGTLVIVGLIALIVIIFALMGLKIIQQGETKVIERLGKYHSTLSSGINIIWPILDKPRKIYVRFVREGYDGENRVVVRLSDKIDLREQVYDFPEQSVITKDNVTTRINALLYFQITDPFKAVYEIDNLPNAIEKLTQTTLRNVIGELELDETLTSRDTINSKLRAVLDEASNKWGVKGPCKDSSGRGRSRGHCQDCRSNKGHPVRSSRLYARREVHRNHEGNGQRQGHQDRLHAVRSLLHAQLPRQHPRPFRQEVICPGVMGE